MSIFIRVSRFGSPAKVIRAQSLHVRFGQDLYGALNFSSPHVPWGSLLATGNHSVLIPETERMEIAGAKPKSLEAIPLIDGLTCTIGDTSLSFFVTSSAAQALAQTPELLEALDSQLAVEELPSLSFALAGIGHVVPLFPGATYSLGSAATSAICLPIAGVAPHHADICVTHGEVTVTTREGSFETIQEPGCKVTFSLPLSIKLTPTGITLQLRAEAAPPPLLR